MGFEGRGLPLDSGGGVGWLLIVVGGVKAVVSNSLAVGMFSVSPPPPKASVPSVERSFHVALVA